MNLDLLLVAFSKRIQNFSVDFGAAFFPFITESCVIGDVGPRLPVQLPDHLFLPVAPSLVTCPHSICQRDDHECIKEKWIADNFRKLFHCRGILRVSGSRNATHLPMEIDQRDQQFQALRRELQATCNFLRRKGTGLFVTSGVCGLPRIVQEHRQVQDRRIFNVAEDLCVPGQFGIGG